MKHQFWAHSSGQIIAVAMDAAGQIIGACGPIAAEEAETMELLNYHYDENPTLTQHVKTHVDEYALWFPGDVLGSYSVARAAEILGLRNRQVRKLADQLGVGRKDGRPWRFTAHDIERMRGRKTKPGPKAAE